MVLHSRVLQDLTIHHNHSPTNTVLAVYPPTLFTILAVQQVVSQERIFCLTTCAHVSLLPQGQSGAAMPGEKDV